MHKGFRYTGVALTLLTGMLFCSTSHAQTSKLGENTDSKGKTSNTTVVMLGTGTPVFKHERAGQAILVVVDKEMFLFDAGPGFVRNFDALSGQEFMPPDIYFDSERSVYAQMDKVFITHLDSDHVLGLPELLLRPWIMGRDKPLRVVGPEGLGSMINHITAAYQADIDHRLNGPQPATKNGYKARVDEIDSKQVVYDDGKVTITAFPVFHGSWPHGMAFGYRVETPDKTVVLSGDTRKSEKLYSYYADADILIHEVMSEEGVSGLAPDWQNYMYDAHTSTKQLAEIARTVEPQLLVLNHPLLFGQTDEQLVAEMNRYYDGGFELAQDMAIYR